MSPLEDDHVVSKEDCGIDNILNIEEVVQLLAIESRGEDA